MKKLLLASVVAAFPFAAGATDTSITALIEGYGGYNWVSSNNIGNNEEDQYGLIGGWAGVNIPVVGASGIQLENFGEVTTNGNTGDNYNFSIGTAAHLFWRDPSRGLFGVMGGGFFSNVGVDSDGRDEDHAWGGLIGVEGQAYLGMTTLYGQAGYATYFNVPPDDDDTVGQDPDFPRDTVFVRGVTRHFVNDNTKLEGELGGAFGKFDEDDEDDFYIVNWALEVEHAYMGPMPFSAFARYEGIYANQDAENDYSLDSTVKVGVRTRIGGAAESLYANDRQGVSLDTPDFGRWGGVLNAPIE